MDNVREVLDTVIELRPSNALFTRFGSEPATLPIATSDHAYTSVLILPPDKTNAVLPE